MKVAPLVGAWIEINEFVNSGDDVKSLLSWERGLKYDYCLCNSIYKGVAPLVGAWIEIKLSHTELSEESVAPLVGAWIEIN